ncbi:hypothetical protein [Priestia megaterium]
MDFKKLIERGELVKKERFAKVIANNKKKLAEKEQKNQHYAYTK